MPSIVNSNSLTLGNIGRGDTIERFDAAMKKVLENIKDENTDLKKRKIVITVEVIPNEDRDQADFHVDVEPKLRKVYPYTSSIIIGQDIYGEIEAHEAIEVPDEATFESDPPGPDDNTTDTSVDEIIPDPDTNSETESEPTVEEHELDNI